MFSILAPLPLSESPAHWVSEKFISLLINHDRQRVIFKVDLFKSLIFFYVSVPSPVFLLDISVGVHFVALGVLYEFKTHCYSI